MKRHSILLFTLIVVVLTTISIAQQSGNVTFEVKDESGAVIPGAEVHVVLESQQQSPVTEARTSTNGRASLTLLPGTYVAAVSAKAFAPVGKQFVIAGDAKQTVAFALRVGGCSGYCMEVTPASGIGGRVVDPAGAVITTGARVFVHADIDTTRDPRLPEKIPVAGDEPSNKSVPEDVTVLADAAGSYLVTLLPGFYDVFVTAPGWTPVAEKVLVENGKLTNFVAKLGLDARQTQRQIVLTH